MRRSLRILLVSTFFVAALAASLVHGADFEPPYLVLILNTVFIAVGGIAVAWLSGLSYLRGAPVTMLLLGCGGLIMALSSVIAGYLTSNPDAGVTIYNLSFDLAALLQLASAILLTVGMVGIPGRLHLRTWLAVGLGGSALAVIVISLLAVGDFLPQFFVAGVGGTMARDFSIGLAVASFAAASGLVALRHHIRRSPVLEWYAVGLALFSIGLLGVGIESSIGDPAGWVGKIAQYAGSVCLVAAVYSAYRQPDAVEDWTRAFMRDPVQMRELFDSMSEGFAYHRIVVDGSGKPVDYVFLDVNPAFSNITGLGMDVVGRRATEVLPGIEKDPADWIGVYGKVALSRQAVTFEKYSTNLKKWYSVSAYSPSTMHFATLFIDVTKRKEMELEVARSNSELQQFAYISSHDLQEPLRMVSSYLRLLERRYGDKLDDQAKEYIGYAVDGARHMKELIDDLLAYSRLQAEPRPMRTCDLNKVCARAIENLGDAVSRNTATITVEPLPTVKADEVQMVQLFQNLLSNAVKFHHGEGPNVKVRATEGADAWTLSVQDDGIGIEPQYHQRIFEMFSRLHPRDEYEGTGIGLAVARRIVERHGGRIWVESEGMHGSTFFFTLPKNGKSG